MFKREYRYIVLKHKDVNELPASLMDKLEEVILEIDRIRRSAGKPLLSTVVVEKDWPEYELVWQMIEARMTGKQYAVLLEPIAERFNEAGKRIAELEHFAAKVNDIRNSIIGLQNVNWSMHIYPLVEALKEIGIDGEGYEVAREKAKRELDVLNAELAAAQATIQQTRSVLEGCLDEFGFVSASYHSKIVEALALTAGDRTALDAMLVKTRREQAEKDAEICDNEAAKHNGSVPSEFRGICWNIKDAIRQAAERGANSKVKGAAQ